jgi:DHA1 family multidrug resistance protein-like MFS transporter
MNWKVVLALMVCFAVMMSSSYTMLIPFLPIYLSQELHCDDSSINLWSGLLFAVTFAISAFASPLWGKLSDKMGKKPMVIRSSILLAVSYFLGGIVETPFQMFLARAFQGIASGLWPACLVLLSAYTPKSKIGISMGLMQSANICGGILGPLLGGVLATAFGMRNSFFVGATALAIITLITIFFIKEPPSDPNANVPNPQKPKNGGSLELLKNHGVLALLICAGLTNMVILQIQPIATMYVKQLAEEGSNVILLSGVVFSLGGVAGAIASPIWGRTGQKIGFYKTLIAALISAGVLIMLQGVPDKLWLFAISQFAGGLGFSGIFPSCNSILILLTPPSQRGTGFGLLFSAQMLGGAVGPVIGGVIATFLALSTVYVVSGGVLFVLGISLLFLAPAALKISAQNNSEQQSSHSADYIEKIKKQAMEELKKQESSEK